MSQDERDRLRIAIQREWSRRVLEALEMAQVDRLNKMTIRASVGQKKENER